MIYYGFSPVTIKGYSIGVERVSDMQEELEVIHRLHYGETEVLYKSTECNVDYDRLRQLEELSQFIVFTLRDKGGELIGYLQYYVFMDVHSKYVRVGREDAFYIKAEHRKGGLAVALIKYAEEALKVLGCEYIGMTSKGPVGAPDIGPLLERKGYKPVAMYYTKKLEK